MGKINKEINSTPELELLEHELYREKYKARYRKTLRSTIYALVIVAAISVLVATLFLPVLQINGHSMEPTLKPGNIAVSIKVGSYHTSDVCAMYYNNRILIKRIIASPGQFVNIDEDGNVFVDGEMLDEPYLREKSKGTTDLEYPYQVPESSYFVMGDNREESQDSRIKDFGCISKENIVGKIVFSVWPLSDFGIVS